VSDGTEDQEEEEEEEEEEKSGDDRGMAENESTREMEKVRLEPNRKPM
jgi:hypothetical protein